MVVRAVPVLAALALLSSACGGGGKENASPAAADVVPARARALVSIDTDFSSAQWRRQLALLHRFPGAAALLRRAGSASGHLDFERDVKPALGPEVDVVWLDSANGGDAVALTQPRNERRLAALIRKANSSGGSQLVVTKVEGWTIVADSRATLARFRNAASSGDALADDDAFQEAMGKLDTTAAVRAYVAGRAVQKALDDALERRGAPPHLTPAVGRLESLSASARAAENGIRVGGGIVLDPPLDPQPYPATLPDAVPAGALLYVSTNSLDDMARTVLRLVSRSLPKFETQLAQAEAVLGFQVRTDVLPLLAHEAAVALYPARRLPTFVVVVKVGDTAKAQQIFSRLSGVIALGANVETKTLSVGGVQVTELDFVRRGVRPLKTYFASFEGKFAFTTSEGTMRQVVQGPAATLAGDPSFRAAKAAARMPRQTTGFAYANLHKGLPFGVRLAMTDGSTISPEAIANTRPLRTALVYTYEQDDSLQLSGFAAIK